MTICARAACDNPVTDTTVCRNCVDALMSALRGVPALVAELETTITRQTCLGGGNSRRGRADTAPLPVDLRAAEAAHRLRAELVSCVRHLWAQGAPRRWACRDCGLPQGQHGPHARWCDPLVVWRTVIPPVDCEDTVEGMAGWLSRRPNWVAMDEIGGDLVDALLSVINAGWRAVDRPPNDRVYAGPCDGKGAVSDIQGVPPCGYTISAAAKSSYARCTVCGREYEVKKRREWMLASLEDHLGSSSYVAQICTGLGVKVSDSTIRMWVKRKKLRPRQWIPSPNDSHHLRPLYRVGDVVAVAAGQDVGYLT